MYDEAKAFIILFWVTNDKKKDKGPDFPHWGFRGHWHNEWQRWTGMVTSFLRRAKPGVIQHLGRGIYPFPLLPACWRIAPNGSWLWIGNLSLKLKLRFPYLGKQDNAWRWRTVALASSTDRYRARHRSGRLRGAWSVSLFLARQSRESGRVISVQSQAPHGLSAGKEMRRKTKKIPMYFSNPNTGTCWCFLFNFFLSSMP